MHGTSSVPYPYFPSCSAVDIVTVLRTERSAFRVLVGLRSFSLLQNVQTGSGAHPTSYIRGTGGLLPGGNSAGSRVWTHHHLVPRLRISGNIPPISIYDFMTCVGRTSFFFFFTFPSFVTFTKHQLWCHDHWFPPFPVLVVLFSISNLHSDGRKKRFVTSSFLFLLLLTFPLQ